MLKSSSSLPTTGGGLKRKAKSDHLLTARRRLDAVIREEQAAKPRKAKRGEAEQYVEEFDVELGRDSCTIKTRIWQHRPAHTAGKPNKFGAHTSVNDGQGYFEAVFNGFVALQGAGELDQLTGEINRLIKKLKGTATRGSRPAKADHDEHR